MTIKKLTQVDTATRKDINNLLAQMRDESSEHTATMSEIKELTTNKNVALIVAKDGKKIVGMATLYILQKLGKRVGRIEDVIVDTTYRGRGLGTQIMQKIISVARAKKLQTLHVNSRPVHVAGNKLYRKIGFKIKGTNPYRLTL
jgi:ribosomal protein S18 acetylase RimI-like enzyme